MQVPVDTSGKRAAHPREVVTERGERAHDAPRSSGVASRGADAGAPSQAAPAGVVEITDDDYRSVWRPCEALEEAQDAGGGSSRP